MARLAFRRLVAPVLILIALMVPAASQTLSIVSGGQRHTFNVELAATPEERARGLMYRREIAADYGMLFDFGDPEQPVMMWMKNTYVSLDMIFVRKDGTIHSIAEYTTPFSTETISSNGAVKGVLEVAAGTARRLGLKPGDRIDHPLFSMR